MVVSFIDTNPFSTVVEVGGHLPKERSRILKFLVILFITLCKPNLTFRLKIQTYNLSKETVLKRSRCILIEFVSGSKLT